MLRHSSVYKLDTGAQLTVSMLPHVSLAKRSCSERLFTHGTLEWPQHVAGVDVHVSRQGAVGGEAGTTHLTRVLLQADVGPHVGLQDSRGHESTIALVTAVWPLSCWKGKNSLKSIGTMIFK